VFQSNFKNSSSVAISNDDDDDNEEKEKEGEKEGTHNNISSWLWFGLEIHGVYNLVFKAPLNVSPEKNTKHHYSERQIKEQKYAISAIK